jgi:hypothetical protein
MIITIYKKVIFIKINKLMTETIYINTKAKDLFKKLGCGIIDTITIYRKEDGKLFFRAGSGKFHCYENELEEYRLA